MMRFQVDYTIYAGRSFEIEDTGSVTLRIKARRRTRFGDLMHPQSQAANTADAHLMKHHKTYRKALAKVLTVTEL